MARLVALLLGVLAPCACNVVHAERSSDSLVQAFNAGLVRIIHSGEWHNIVLKWSKQFAASWTCNPDPDRYPFPAYTSLTTRHTLEAVLSAGVLKVGAFESDYGNDGDYTVNPPVGFYPDILSAVVAQIRQHYSRHLPSQALLVQRQYFGTSARLLAALRSGSKADSAHRIDMTEPFMFVSSLYPDPTDGETYFRHEKFSASCALGSATHTGFTRKSSTIFTQQGLNDYIAAQSSPVLIGTLTQGNFGQYRPLLHSNAQGVFASEVRVLSKQDADLVADNLNANLESVQSFTVGSATVGRNWTLAAVREDGQASPQQLRQLEDYTTFLNMSTSYDLHLTFDHFSDTDHLVDAVVRGDVTAGIVSAVPTLTQDSRLNAFDMSALSPQAALFRMDEPMDMCSPDEGFIPTLCESSYHLAEHALTSSLARAVDAAIVRVTASGTWEKIVRRNSKPMAASWTCSPEPARYDFPNETALHSAEVLKQVLDNGVLRVGGFESNWGSDGDYTVDPAVGFYPEIMDAIVDEIRLAYGRDATTLRLQRVFLDTSPNILEALRSAQNAEKQIDMTEPYLLVSALYEDPEEKRSYFRHERFHMSCAIGSAENVGFTRSNSGIYTQNELNAFIDREWSTGQRTTSIGTLTEGNFETYRPVLSSRAAGSFASDVAVDTPAAMRQLLNSLNANLEAASAFDFGTFKILQGWTLTAVKVGSAAASTVSKAADIAVDSLDYTAGVLCVFDHFTDTAHLVEAVIRGDVTAGIVSATQSLFENTDLNTFKLNLLSPQAALFRLDGPRDICPANGFVQRGDENTCKPVPDDIANGGRHQAAGLGWLAFVAAAVAVKAAASG